MSAGLIDISQEIAVLEDTPLVSEYQPNAGGQDQFAHSKKHQIILSGANDSGKTYSGMMMDAWHLIPEIDELGNETGYTIHPNLRIKLDPAGILGWISSYSQDVQLDTIHPQYEKIFRPYVHKEYREEGVLHWFETKSPAGSTGFVNFKWQTQGWEAYRGAKVNFIHLDEPHAEAIYNECVARLFDKEGYMWTTMTPIVDPKVSPSRIRDVIWMVKRLVEPYFRNKAKFPELEIIFIDLEENAAYVNTQFAKDMLAGVSEDEYIIRTKGRFLIIMGMTAFNERRLDRLHFYQSDNPELSIPEYGYLHYNVEGTDHNEDVYFEELDQEDYPDDPENDGEYIVRIWQRPIKEQLGIVPDYHIGADLSEGKQGGDPMCAYVKRADTRQIVASVAGYLDAEEAAKQLNLLGRYYRSADGSLAKLALEVNNPGPSMSYLLNGSSELGIKKYDAISLYQRPTTDNLALGLHIPSPHYGWLTTRGNRHYLVGQGRGLLARAMDQIERRGPLLIPDSGWVSEARTFVKDNRGKFKAAEGFHDDRIIASGIADMSIEQGVFQAPVYQPMAQEPREPARLFTDDPKDPRGQTTILNMAEIRRRRTEMRQNLRPKAANDIYK